MTRRQALVVVAVVLTSIGRPQAQDNPQATTGSWRPTIVAQHGMVAAGHPLAAEAGMRILKAGGNAMDAAIATWAVQGEVEPGMTGLGADMFVLYYNAKTREVKFINGTGFAAQAATIDFYKSKGGIPDEGPLSIAVPGAVGGAAYAVKTYGTKTLAEVLKPAIEIADEGFPVSEALADDMALMGMQRDKITVHTTGPSENAKLAMKTTRATSVRTPPAVTLVDEPAVLSNPAKATATAPRLTVMPTRPASSSGRRPNRST